MSDKLKGFVEWEEVGPQHHRIYAWLDSVDNIIDMIEQRGEWKWDDHPFRSDGWGETWAGTKSIEQALHYLKYGWEHIAGEMYIEDAALKVEREIEPEFRTYMDYSGGAVDVGAYLAGTPECMVSFETKPRKKKTVNILFNICSSAGSSKEHIMKRGYTVTLICDYLERSGYRVRIDVADTAYGWGGNYGGKRSHWTLAFCAKDYAQPLDFGRIGFMLGSPAMLRRIFFGVEATSKFWMATIGASYGSVAPVHPKVGNEYDYVFDYNTPINAQSAEKCIEYIVTGKSNQVDITGGLNDDWS